MSKAEEVDNFIASIEGDLRVGGGATLDELYNLACILRDILTRIDL